MKILLNFLICLLLYYLSYESSNNERIPHYGYSCRDLLRSKQEIVDELIDKYKKELINKLSLAENYKKLFDKIRNSIQNSQRYENIELINEDIYNNLKRYQYDAFTFSKLCHDKVLKNCEDSLNCLTQEYNAYSIGIKYISDISPKLEVVKKSLDDIEKNNPGIFIKPTVTDTKEETTPNKSEVNKRPAIALRSGYSEGSIKDSDVSFYLVDLADKTRKLVFFLTNKRGEILGNIDNLRATLADQQQQLLFATNGGMFQPDLSPQGLFIRNGKIINQVDTKKQLPGQNLNFYLEPNGIFLIDVANKAHIVTTQTYLAYPNNGKIAYATQSGPMLLIEGEINRNFIRGSPNRYIRSGVGVLVDGKVVFAISNQPISFYDFALVFRDLGCGNALYLDGAISKMYVAKQREDESALMTNFGPLIGLVADKTR